jgi:hypothetical protein
MGEHAKPREHRQLFPQLVHRDLQLRGDFLFLGGAAQERFQPGIGVLQPGGGLPDGPGEPVHLAEVVEHRSADPELGVRLELDPARGVESIEGVEQADDPRTDEIVHLDVGGDAHLDARRVVFDRRNEFFHHRVAVGRARGRGLIPFEGRRCFSRCHFASSLEAGVGGLREGEEQQACQEGNCSYLFEI